MAGARQPNDQNPAASLSLLRAMQLIFYDRESTRNAVPDRVLEDSGTIVFVIVGPG